MATCTLRNFEATDSDHLLGWYRADQTGMESLLGQPIPNDTQFMRLFNELFSAALKHHVRFWMVERDSQPLGVFLMTHFEPQEGSVRAHIYVDSAQRQHSFEAGKVINDTLASEVAASGVKRVYAQQPRAQRGAFALAKRMGFKEVPTVMLVKEL